MRGTRECTAKQSATERHKDSAVATTMVARVGTRANPLVEVVVCVLSVGLIAALVVDLVE